MKNKNILYVVIGLIAIAILIFIFSDEKKASDDKIVYNQNQYDQKLDEIKKGSENKDIVVKKDENKPKPKPNPYAGPSIKVLSPNGGERFSLNKNTYTIKWKTTGLSSTDIVNIALKDNSKYCAPGLVGCSTGFIIASVPNTGSYVWNLNQKMSGPSTGPNSISVYPGQRFKIVLTASINTADLPPVFTDESDGEFEIFLCPLISLPQPGWCSYGVIIGTSHIDENGCFVPPVCSYTNTFDAKPN